MLITPRVNSCRGGGGAGSARAGLPVLPTGTGVPQGHLQTPPTFQADGNAMQIGGREGKGMPAEGRQRCWLSLLRSWKASEGRDGSAADVGLAAAAWCGKPCSKAPTA